MSASPHALRVAALAALAACVIVGCGADRRGGSAEQAPVPLAFEGLSASLHDGETLVSRLRAEQLLVVPSQVGPFRIAGLHELVLTRARYDVFLRPEGLAGSAPARSRRKGLLAEPVRPGVRVVAGSVHGLEWWTSRAGEAVTRVDASRARIDVRSGDVTLHGFRMVHLPTSRSLEAARAVWHEGTREFAVEGEFVLREAARVLRGRGLRVDAELRVVGR